MGGCQALASCKPIACGPSMHVAQNDSSEVRLTDIEIINDDAILRESYEQIKIAPLARIERNDEPYEVLVGKVYRRNSRTDKSIQKMQPMSNGENFSDRPEKVSPQQMDHNHHATTNMLGKLSGQATALFSDQYKIVGHDGDEPPFLETSGQSTLKSWRYGALAGSLVMRGDNSISIPRNDTDSEGSDWMEGKRRSLARAKAEQKDLDLLSTDVEDTHVDLADLDKDLMFDVFFVR